MDEDGRNEEQPRAVDEVKGDREPPEVLRKEVAHERGEQA
jgi:hypothetical protein